jgi:hypothetical protein
VKVRNAMRMENCINACKQRCIASQALPPSSGRLFETGLMASNAQQAAVEVYVFG